MTIIQKFQKKVKEKNRVLESARKLSGVRDKIINLFEKGIFPYKDNVFKTKEKKSEEESEEESEENKLERIKDDYKKFIKHIEDESKSITLNCSKDILFNFVVPSTLIKQLYKSKNKKDNNKLVHVIKSGLSDLKDEIKKIPENEIQTEKPDKI